MITEAASSRRFGSIVLPLDALVLAALMIANCAWAVLWPSPLTTFAALFIWLIALTRLFAADPSSVVVLLPLLILHLSVMVSLAAIESGAAMKEMGHVGRASSASASFVIYSLLFVLTASTVYRRRRDRPGHARQTPIAALTPRPFILAWIALVIGAFIVCYLALAGVRTGFPLLTGTDRFVYRRFSADVLTLNFLNYKFVLAALLGSSAVFAATATMRNAHHVVFLSYLLVSFLFGDKFFIILSATASYGMPFLIRDPQGISRAIRRLAPLSLAVVACVFVITLFIYSDYGQLSLDTTLTKLGGRVAGQGQLWYLAVEYSSHAFSLDPEMLRLNLANLFANPAADFAFEHRLAAFYFVEKFSPTAMHTSFIHNGGSVTPTMVFEAYGLVGFGYLGLAVLVAAMGCVVGALAAWLVRAMMSGNPVNVLLPAQVLAQSLVVMTQGTLYSILSVSTFKTYAAYFVLQVIVAELVKPRASLKGHPA